VVRIFGSMRRTSRVRVAAQQPAYARLRLVLCGLILAAGLWAIAIFRLPGNPDIQIGQPSPVTFKSPRSTIFVSEVRTEEARQSVANVEENQVYRTDPQIPIRQRQRLQEVLAQTDAVRADRALSPDERAQRIIELFGPDLSLPLEQAAFIVTLTNSEWEAVTTRSLELYSNALSDYRYSLDADAVRQVRELYLPLNMPPGLSKPPQDLVTLLVGAFLLPNRSLDIEKTNEQVAAARAAVPPVQVRVLKDELIVQEGALVKPDDMEKLQALGLAQARNGWAQLVSRGLLSAMIALLFCVYVYLYQDEIWPSLRALLVIVGLMLATALAAKLLLPTWRSAPYAFPLAAASMLLVVLFNSHLALFVTLLLAIMLGLLSDELFMLTVIGTVSGFVAIFSVRKLERSATFLLAGLLVALATFGSELAFWLNSLSELRLDDLGTIATFSGINGGLSAMLALGLLNPLGRIAGVVTPVQLLELAHPTQPLLRRLMREAPGTYYHSINVSNLAEAAAEVVGADALLLRVGAYYHDIGKLIRPYFFTDNQIDRQNVHDELDPHTSVEIIIDHVREGVKMAEQARLPRQIIDFIRTHHGTSIAGHFYQAALQREDAVDIAEYTYPGPKPQTKDQAILMLADSVEATVRAKSQSGKLRGFRNDEAAGDGRERNGQTVAELVEQIVDGRMRSGQLDESPLTLRDVALIKQAFTNTLQGIYHPRVDYQQLTPSQVSA
jgi:cyclic-di-AMP phosphodiesterase PgpH